MAEERERVRRQLALDTKRRQRLFEQKAKEREAAEEELVRAHHSPFPPPSGPPQLLSAGHRSSHIIVSFPLDVFFFTRRKRLTRTERSSSPSPIPSRLRVVRPSAS